ncbi:MAG TPA: hypothetical protein PK733_15130 [Clostridiales bacterium]|nr:hypothetical protein [Clostridiales bacterium]
MHQLAKFSHFGRALGLFLPTSTHRATSAAHGKDSVVRFVAVANAEYINKLIRSSLTLLKERLLHLLKTLEGFEKDNDCYCMIHFDYNDGNYSIDFDTGQITVYDFDNSLFGWYMYNLADLWGNGQRVIEEPIYGILIYLFYRNFGLDLHNIPKCFEDFKLTFHFGGLYKIISDE